MPSISLVTTTRTFVLEAIQGELVLDVLKRNGIPRSSVLLLDSDHRFFSMARPLYDGDDIFAYALRNVEYDALIPDCAVSTTIDVAATEVITDSVEAAGKIISTLTRNDAFELVFRSVADILDRYLETADANGSTTLQLGLSPGGDGRILAECLQRYRDERADIDIESIIVGAGFEEEHEHVTHAVALAERYGLPFTVYSSKEAGQLLGFRFGLDELAEQYRREHPSDSAEMLPTYLLQQLHFAVAKQEKRRAILMGYNFEDVLTERLYQLMTNSPLPPFPIRRLRDFDIIAPLSFIEKHLLDALDVPNSLRNYQARRPTGGDLRSVLYLMSYSLNQISPTVCRALAHGANWESDPVVFDQWINQRQEKQ